MWVGVYADSTPSSALTYSTGDRDGCIIRSVHVVSMHLAHKYMSLITHSKWCDIMCKITCSHSTGTH